MEADKNVGRRHLLIAYGKRAGDFCYALFILLTIITVLYLIYSQQLPAFSVIALLPMPLAFYSLSGAVKYGVRLGYYPKYLAANVVVSISTPVLLGLSILLA